MEGAAYALRHNLEVAADGGTTAVELSAMGGAANSRLWTQIKAEVTGRVIKVPTSDTATTLGAALLAGVGTGLYQDFETAVRQTVRITRVHEPNPDHYEAYEKGYQIYRQLYEQLQGIMKE